MPDTPLLTVRLISVQCEKPEDFYKRPLIIETPFDVQIPMTTELLSHYPLFQSVYPCSGVCDFFLREAASIYFNTTRVYVDLCRPVVRGSSCCPCGYSVFVQEKRALKGGGVSDKETRVRKFDFVEPQFFYNGKPVTHDQLQRICEGFSHMLRGRWMSHPVPELLGFACHAIPDALEAVAGKNNPVNEDY